MKCYSSHVLSAPQKSQFDARRQIISSLLNCLSRNTKGYLKSHHGGEKAEELGCGLFSLVQTPPIASVSYWCSTYRSENLLDMYTIPLDSAGVMASWIFCCLLCHNWDFGCGFPRDCFSSHHHDQLTVVGSLWGFHLRLPQRSLAKISWALPWLPLCIEAQWPHAPSFWLLRLLLCLDKKPHCGLGCGIWFPDHLSK